MRIHMVFVSISIAMFSGAIYSPGFAENKSSDWIAIEEHVHSKEVLSATWKEFEKSDLFLSFVFPDQASIEILKPFNRIEPKANRAEIKAYVAKQTKKDFVCADILTGNEEDIKDVKAFLLTLGYERVLFQKGQGIGYPCIIYDSLNHPLDRPEDSRKNEQKN